MLFLCLFFPTRSISIDITQQKPISPYIYGANNMQWGKMGTGYPMVRQGGNRMTAYNWETNASNAGSDYQHQNDGFLSESAEPGLVSSSYMKAAQENGAAVLLTIPTLGYVSADKNGNGDVNKTPNYLSVRFNKSYAKKPGGKFAYPPDLTDKAVYQDEFVAYLEKTKSAKTPVWYSLDNEPDIWSGTHARIHPNKLTFAEIIANNTEYASAIKAVAPKTLIFGPANYGWQGFRTLQDAPDRNNRDFLDTYLSAMKSAEESAGKRLLDVLDIHWYPEAQGGGVRITEKDANAETAAARIQAPRSLWDTSYVEKSWIIDTLGGKPINLLPRVLGQIDAHYPGTKLAITEYNYGGDKAGSGLVAQADALGIFGRYGLFSACNWGISPGSPAQIAGFGAFLNFDGRGSKFGDLSVAVKGEIASENSVYASMSSNNKKRLTLVMVNKLTGDQKFVVSLPSTAKLVRAYVQDPLAPGFPKTIEAIPSGTNLSIKLPATSVVTAEVLF